MTTVDTKRLRELHAAASPTEATHCCGFNCECCPFDDGETPLEKREEEWRNAIDAAGAALLDRLDALEAERRRLLHAQRPLHKGDCEAMFFGCRGEPEPECTCGREAESFAALARLTP